MGNFNRAGGRRFNDRDDRGGDRGGDRRGGFRGRSDRGGFGGGRFGSRDRFEDRGERQMYQAVCSECGNACEVPFKPTGSKPVLCNDCFRGGREDRGGRERREGGRDFGRRSFSESGSTAGLSAEHVNLQFSQLNEKLDKILKRLTPTYVREQADEVMGTDEATTEEPAELPKPKKVSKKKAKKEKMAETGD